MRCAGRPRLTARVHALLEDILVVAAARRVVLAEEGLLEYPALRALRRRRRRWGRRVHLGADGQEQDLSNDAASGTRSLKNAARTYRWTSICGWVNSEGLSQHLPYVDKFSNYDNVLVPPTRAT